MTDNKFPISPAAEENSPFKQNVDFSKDGEVVVHTITHNDILFGRGSGPNDHPGNITFRQIVSTRRSEYLGTSTRKDKARIAKDILNVVKHLNPPGRFLEKMESAGEQGRKDKNDIKWIIVPEHKATEKVKQALRQTRYRKNECKKLDYKRNNQNYAFTQSAPENILAYKKFQTNQLLQNQHRPPYSPGSIYTEASYHSNFYHHPDNHFLYNTYLAHTSGSYNYNGTSICQHHMSQPSPSPPLPPKTKTKTTHPISNLSPPFLPLHAPSPIKSEKFSNAALKHYSEEKYKVTNHRSHDQQDYSMDFSMKALNLNSESSPTTVFKPEPGQFIFPTPPHTNEETPDTKNYVSFSSISDSLSLFESSGSNKLIPIQMEGIENDDINFDLAAVATIISEKIPQEINIDIECSRSIRYHSKNLQELSSRSLGDGDDFWMYDTKADPQLNTYKRSRDHQNRNIHIENTQHSLDELSYLDDISFHDGATMMEIFQSDSSFSYNEKEILHDSKDWSQVNTYDRMVLVM